MNDGELLRFLDDASLIGETEIPGLRHQGNQKAS
jgi:hypothetical protein